MRNTLTEKATYDRLKTLLSEAKQIADDIKQLVKDAKDQGLDGARLKKLAKADVDGKLDELREQYEALQEAARAVGCDKLELEPELPFGLPATRKPGDGKVEVVLPPRLAGAAAAFRRVAPDANITVADGDPRASLGGGCVLPLPGE